MRALKVPLWPLVGAAIFFLLAEGQSTGQELPPSAIVSNANYAIVCSNAVRKGFPFRVGVAIFPRSRVHGIEMATASLAFASAAGENFTVETTWRRPADDAPVKDTLELSLTLDDAPKQLDSDGRLNLTVSIQDTLGNAYVNSTALSLSQSPVVSLIQTDKAIYKPGQLVKFRIVNLDETLKPVLTGMEVLIKDSRGNLVDKQTHNLTQLDTWQSRAVMTGQFELSDMPNEGSWSIVAKSDLFEETKTFKVQQYVLPKFSLEVTEPSFVHFDDNEFRVSAKVRYTYDQPVEGTFNVTIGPYRNCRYCKQSYNQQENFIEEASPNGEASFSFDMTGWREMLNSTGYTARPFSFSAKATVQFKEKFTGLVKEVEKTFNIYTKRYDLRVDTSLTPFFLPGVEVPVQIKLVRPDSEPFTGAAAADATVEMEYRQRGKKRTQQVFKGPLRASSEGTGVSLSVKIPTMADFHTVKIEASIMGDKSEKLTSSSSIEPFIGVTNDYVKVTKCSCRDGFETTMEKTSGIRMVYYTVLSRGQLQQWGRFSDSGKVTLSQEELDSYVSDTTLVAFGVDRTGEIVAATVNQDASRLGGFVNLTSNLTMNTGEPQQWAKVNIQAEPDSFVFLTGIDASVNLLATGQDILQGTVKNRFNSRIAFRGGYWPGRQRLTTARIIQENRLIVMSDAFYHSEKNYQRDFYQTGHRSRSMVGAALAESAPAPAPPMNQKASGSGGGGGDKLQVRKFFPETMVWTMVQTDSEGRANDSFQLPDTITSWDVTAFGVANARRLQTMDAAFKLKTFKSFFIRPVLPYSVVRGEKFILKVLAFNYRAETAEVRVSLNVTSKNVRVSIVPGQPEEADASLPTVSLSLAGNAAGVALFELTPRGLPSLQLSVRATCRREGVEGSDTDIVVKSVIVEPEGKTVRMSRSVLVTPPANGSSERLEQRVTVTFPEIGQPDLVPGSEVFRYSLVGDVMGPAMQNIGSLLRLPTGCGEQNMVNFAPAVFIWEYLTATGQQAANGGEIRDKAIRFMKVGLQRQLTYKRRDGSYSAFGNRDRAGSTWLTAFVLSIYARAAEFITIEADALTGSSVKFLLDQQTRNGQFKEPPGARVLDSGLQGSSTRASHGMTAFVCLALLDVAEAAARRPELKSTAWKDTDVRGGITKCLWNVNSAFGSNAEAFNSYDVALSAYLLRRAQASAVYRQSSLQRGLDALNSALAAQAETDDTSGGKFWSTEQPYRRSRKRPSVEATAWALLGYSLAGETDESLRILRWLSNQQSGQGGFASSQATVVGIRALAAFAAASGLTNGEAEVAVQFPDVSAIRHVLPEDRRLVLVQSKTRRGPEARVSSAVVSHLSGRGFALATLSWQYNLLDRRPLTANAWKMASGLGIKLGGPVPPKPPPRGQFRLPLCARGNFSASDGMVLMRVSNPSGFMASRLPDTDIVAGLKRVETGPQEVVLYFDYLTRDGACFEIWWSREVPVLELSPQQISLQKYYNPEQIVTASYLAPELQSLTRCAACPDCPECAVQPDAQPVKASAEEDSWMAWLG